MEDVCTLKVVEVKEDSLFAESDLMIGMSIHTVNEKTFSSMDMGMELLKSVEGIFAILVYTVPTIGTVYTTRRKSD